MFIYLFFISIRDTVYGGGDKAFQVEEVRDCFNPRP